MSLPMQIRAVFRVIEVAEFETQAGGGAYRVRLRAVPTDPTLGNVAGEMEFSTVVELPLVRGQKVLVTMVPID